METKQSISLSLTLFLSNLDANENHKTNRGIIKTFHLQRPTPRIGFIFFAAFISSLQKRLPYAGSAVDHFDRTNSTNLIKNLLILYVTNYSDSVLRL